MKRKAFLKTLAIIPAIPLAIKKLMADDPPKPIPANEPFYAVKTTEVNSITISSNKIPFEIMAENKIIASGKGYFNIHMEREIPNNLTWNGTTIYGHPITTHVRFTTIIKGEIKVKEWQGITPHEMNGTIRLVLNYNTDSQASTIQINENIYNGEFMVFDLDITGIATLDKYYFEFKVNEPAYIEIK